MFRREVGAEIKKLRLARSIAGFDRVDTSLCANLTEPVEIHPREPETGCGCLRAIRNITRQVDASPNRSARSGRTEPLEATPKQSRLVRFLDASADAGWRRRSGVARAVKRNLEADNGTNLEHEVTMPSGATEFLAAVGC